MYDTICTLPLPSDLFCQAVHPTDPLVSVGLVSGHVQSYRLPPVASDSESETDATLASESGFGTIETSWSTRRHKGSCRTIGYGVDGSVLYSAGTDGLVKAADSSTGKVFSKIRTPLIDRQTQEFDQPALLHALSPQTLLLATDSAYLHLYDIRENNLTSSKPSQSHRPHTDEYVSSLTPLPPSDASTSGFSKQWVTTGGTTVAVTDLRRGVLVQSESQEEELLSSVYVGGLSKRGTSRGEKVVVGGGGGVLTLWERGVWDDQDERIHVDRTGESLDVLTLLPTNTRPTIAVGLGDGSIRFVEIGQNRTVSSLRHDDVERVSAISFDVGGRMISGGGQTVKVWYEKPVKATVTESDDSDLEPNGSAKRDRSEASGGSDEDSSEDEQEDKVKRKKKKRNKGKKQEVGGRKNGILGFKGLE